MFLGLKNGHSIKGDNETKTKSYNLTKVFTDFRNNHGHIVCKNLLGYDLSNTKDYNFLVQQGIFKTECPKYISGAIEILEDMLRNGEI